MLPRRVYSLSILLTSYLACHLVGCQDKDDEKASCTQTSSAGLGSDYFSPLKDLAATSNLDKSRAIPDLPQARAEEMLAGGKNLCAPVAASNSLMWLAANGYAQISSGLNGSDDTAKQIALAVRLSSSDYMNTDLSEGTGPSEFLVGLNKFLTDRGLSGYKLIYQGWRPYKSAFEGGSKIPLLVDFVSGLNNQEATWLNVGWYTLDKSTCKYNRNGGHWLTLTGYDFTDVEKPVLKIHDPAGRSGANAREENATFARIDDGTLEGSNKGLPINAADYLSIGGELSISNDGELAVLDGVVRLKLR